MWKWEGQEEEIRPHCLKFRLYNSRVLRGARWWTVESVCDSDKTLQTKQRVLQHSQLFFLYLRLKSWHSFTLHSSIQQIFTYWSLLYARQWMYVHKPVFLELSYSFSFHSISSPFQISMVLFAYMLTSEFVFLAFPSLSYRPIFSSAFWISSFKNLSIFNSSFLRWYIHQVFIEHLQCARHKARDNGYRHHNSMCLNLFLFL